MNDDNDETTLPFPCSDVAAVFGTDAIRLFYAGALCDDCGIRMDGISILYAPKGCGNVGVCDTGSVVSADLQDSIGTNDMEHRRCDSGSFPYLLILHGKATGKDYY